MKLIVIGEIPSNVSGYDHDSWEDEEFWEDYAMWGLRINEVYDTLQDWIDARPIPMEEDTRLIGVGIELPPADDPVYSPYNIDGVYTFSIENQVAGLYKYRNNLRLNLALEL